MGTVDCVVHKGFVVRRVFLDQLDLVDLAVCLVKEVSQDLLVSVAAVVQMVHLVHVGHEVLWEHLAKLVLLERRGCRVILESEAQLESVEHWESAGKRARMAPMGRKAKMVGVGCQAKLVSQAVRALVVVKDQLVWAWLARMERMASMASLALMVNLAPMVKRDPRVTA